MNTNQKHIIMKHFVAVALIFFILVCNCNAYTLHSNVVPQLGGFYNQTGTVLDSFRDAAINGLQAVRNSFSSALNFLDDSEGEKITEVRRLLDLSFQEIAAGIDEVFIQSLQLGQDLLRLDDGPTFLQEAERLIKETVEIISKIFEDSLKKSKSLINDTAKSLETLIGSTSNAVGAGLTPIALKIHVYESAMTEETSAASSTIAKLLFNLHNVFDV